MTEFFAMGGYAAYVWWAYGITAAILVGLAVVTIRRARARDAELTDLQSRLGSSRVGAAR